MPGGAYASLPSKALLLGAVAAATAHSTPLSPSLPPTMAHGCMDDTSLPGVSTVGRIRTERRACWHCRALRACLAVAAASCGAGALAYTSPSPAIQYYKKALRGAADMRPEHESSAMFNTLATMHYQAVRLRRAHDFRHASAVYQRAMDLHRGGLVPHADEVPSAVAAAHTSLNLALTEQAQQSFDVARRTFQDGVAFVQTLIRAENSAWVDGHSRVRFELPGAPTEPTAGLQVALQWLATLLTAWALLETKRGHIDLARLLAQRAAHLDGSKAPLQRWRLIGPASAGAAASPV